ncbi:Kdo hydroxylase family protein [Andreprevotia chitinilytica]|uniref:Kdo hydroxylase family protein n=1 Tax=Andreprevotia chitinilytica TaxID=396808 RepID=UPI0009FCC977|nr:Kdo hydroxylase family protein [Andreprevotia chitinilytica]
MNIALNPQRALPEILSGKGNPLVILPGADWQQTHWRLADNTRTALLEQGKVLFFPQLAFALSDTERTLLDPQFADPKRKNISLDGKTGLLRGVAGNGATQTTFHQLVARYAQQATTLVDHLFPHYRGHLRAAPTSLRLHRVETRRTSWRHDDSRLHIDAFPSRPNHGERILRVFTNINPHGEPRVWQVGEPFQDVAEHMLPRLPRQWPGSAALLKALRITKQRRSAYDHIMLHLHDAMKADAYYQSDSGQQTIAFPPGSVWICFSDQVPHAVVSGQFMLEQTFFLSPTDMAHPDESPLAVLERLTGRPLVGAPEQPFTPKAPPLFDTIREMLVDGASTNHKTPAAGF